MGSSGVNDNPSSTLLHYIWEQWELWKLLLGGRGSSCLLAAFGKLGLIVIEELGQTEKIETLWVCVRVGRPQSSSAVIDPPTNQTETGFVHRRDQGPLTSPI
jgi:hypothetical protein